MKIILFVSSLAAGVFPLTAVRGEPLSTDEPLRPVPIVRVDIQDDFWSPRIEVNRTVTLFHALRKYAETDHPAGSVGYKLIEAASYSLGKHPDAELEAIISQTIDDVLAEILPREPDGRWLDLRWDAKLYYAGHLFEAAAAHHQATGDQKLLDAAVQVANHIDSLFGPTERRDVPAHQEIELGLSRLYRLTGQDRYARLAKFFLDERGVSREFFGRTLFGPYAQDHEPVVQQTAAVGHAVRATYMYSGMADLAAAFGADEYLPPLRSIWKDVVSKKLYVTGSLGSRRLFEGFGAPYELPNFTCWNETCASVGNIFWNHRLFLLDRDAKYLDVLERSLYNGFLVGVSLSGDRFFYQNRLKSFGELERSDWFGVPCCPPNVARLLASLGNYIYAQSDNDLFVNLFISSRARITLDQGDVRIAQKSRYPWDGHIEIAVDPESSGAFAVHVRIPGWARGRPVPSDLYRYADPSVEPPVVRVDGKSVTAELDKGFVRIERTWEKGDVIEVELPMPVRQVAAHESVADDRGKVALERGPVVFCVEGLDNGGKVSDLQVPEGVWFTARFRDDLLRGVMTVEGEVKRLRRGDDGVAVESRPHDLVAVPYSTWANRGPGEMEVWLAKDASRVKLEPAPSLASSSSVTSSPSRPSGAPGIGNHEGLHDQMEPLHSSDASFSYFRVIPEDGPTGWVQYDFDGPEEVSSVEVFWLDDHRFCRFPESWRVVYKDGDVWRPVQNRSPYGVEPDRFNLVEFESVQTDGLRIEMTLPRQMYYDGQIGPPDGSFIEGEPVEWYETGIIELRIR